MYKEIPQFYHFYIIYWRYICTKLFRNTTNGALNTAEFDFPDSINAEQPWIREAPVGDWFYTPGFTYDSGCMIRFVIEAISRDCNAALNIPMRPDGSIEDECVTMFEEVDEWMLQNTANDIRAIASGYLCGCFTILTLWLFLDFNY